MLGTVIDMLVLDVLVVALALVGHVGLWATVVNRVHATALSQPIVKLITYSGLAFLGLAPLGAAVWAIWEGAVALGGINFARLPLAVKIYGGLVLLLSPGSLVWYWRYGSHRPQSNALTKAAADVTAAGLVLHAGHGLTYLNVGEVAAVPEIEELNIGHSIVSRAVFEGLEGAVRRMRRLMSDARAGSGRP